MMDDFSKPRVNAATLSSFQGRTVCLLGIAKDVDSNGTSFTLTTSDGKNVKVQMQEPLSEYVNGLTEVHGEVLSSMSIQCQHYIAFPQEYSSGFDMDLYNTAVEMTGSLSQHYIVGVQKS